MNKLKELNPTTTFLSDSEITTEQIINAIIELYFESDMGINALTETIFAKLLFDFKFKEGYLVFNFMGDASYKYLPEHGYICEDDFLHLKNILISDETSFKLRSNELHERSSNTYRTVDGNVYMDTDLTLAKHLIRTYKNFKYSLSINIEEMSLTWGKRWVIKILIGYLQSEVGNEIS